MRLAIMEYYDDEKCQKMEDCLHQKTPYNLEKENLKAGLKKFIAGN